MISTASFHFFVDDSSFSKEQSSNSKHSTWIKLIVDCILFYNFVAGSPLSRMTRGWGFKKVTKCFLGHIIMFWILKTLRVQKIIIQGIFFSFVFLFHMIYACMTLHLSYKSTKVFTCPSQIRETKSTSIRHMFAA